MTLRSAARKIYTSTIYFFAVVLYYPKLIVFNLTQSKKEKLHIGCGKNIFPGWINADIHPRAELVVFLQMRLPFRDGSLSFIFSEHVLEHVCFDVAKRHLAESHRVLKPGGKIRIAMPDLDNIIDCYINDWRKMDWVNWPQFLYVQSRVQAINMAFRDWGHMYLYNKEEIARLLGEIGFEQISFVAHGVSAEPELCGLETRADSRLIVEARKAARGC